MNALPPTIKAIAYVKRREVELIDFTPEPTPLRKDEVAGRTLTTLVSPGTEISGSFDVERSEPLVGGYAAVFEVSDVGDDVTDMKPGQLALALGPHTAWQRQTRAAVVPIPAGLPATRAVFARLMAVSWATLSTTAARPADRVLVTGLGIIGNLAAQIFAAAGYSVIACDPAEARRTIARRAGLTGVYANAADAIISAGAPSLAIECSGHEQAALDCCRSVTKGGEVVLVGVPWKKRVDLPAFDVLHAVFHRYVHLRSGWEWELPFQPTDFRSGSTVGSLSGALEFLAAGRVKVDGLFRSAVPAEAQSVYDSLYRQKGDYLSAVFDWRDVD